MAEEKSVGGGGGGAETIDEDVEKLDSDWFEDFITDAYYRENHAGFYTSSGHFKNSCDDDSGTGDQNVENLEFGWDTNRLDDLSVALFDVHGDDGLGGIASDGVSSTSPRRLRLQIALSAAPFDVQQGQNQEFGRDINRLGLFHVSPFNDFGDQDASYGGSDRTQQLPPVGIFADDVSGGGGGDDGGEVGLQQQTASDDVATSSPPTNSVPSIDDCMRIVSIFPGFEPGSDLYNKALRLFWQKEARESFMIPPDDEAKLKFLKSVIEQDLLTPDFILGVICSIILILFFVKMNFL